MDTLTEILDKLNDEQIKPVMETEGPVLVLAGAGSGKTRVLTSRIAYLIEAKRVPPSAILAITFTNKAAGEMKERISSVTDAENMWVCTIHSMCVRILRMFPEEAGIRKNFSIYSETERANVIKRSFQECDYDDDKLLKNVKYHIGNAKMLGLSPEEYGKEYAAENDIDDVVRVYARYDKHLQENNALDFDDLLNRTRLLLKGNAEVREYLGGRFRYILVDEFQDTNGVQFEIVCNLASVHKNLFAVGDDDQSIYGWRGAEIENILSFEKTFPNAKVFKLERNYRSTKNILKLANAVIKNNGKRKKKTLWTEQEEGAKPEVYEAEEESGEARHIAYTIAGLMKNGAKYSDFAVLMRLNALTRSLEQEFMSDGIPFKVFGGFKFFERKEIKDLLAYLRAVNNPFDSEAILRIVNFPKRGIGTTTTDKVQAFAAEEDISVYEALFRLDEIGLASGAKQKLETFVGQIKGWVLESLQIPGNDLVKKIVAETNMRQAYADNSDESMNKLANIDEFVNAVEEFYRLNPGAELSDYLNQVTLSSDTDDMDDGNYVTLATIHSVKGLEFKTVFICGLEENILPVARAASSEDDLEEERRLMYVAITRAEERLYLTRSKSRYLYGKREPTMRSRFLKELASEIDLPKERLARAVDYSDDDPEFYGNSTYGAGRFGNKSSSFGGGYGYRSSDRDRTSSAPTRSAWTGNSYGNSYGGSTKKSEPSGGAFTYGGLGSERKQKAAEKDVSAFVRGVVVVHPKFGEGTIVDVRGAGANTVLHVAFAGLGIKQLSASLAPLKLK